MLKNLGCVAAVQDQTVEQGDFLADGGQKLLHDGGGHGDHAVHVFAHFALIAQGPDGCHPLEVGAVVGVSGSGEAGMEQPGLRLGDVGAGGSVGGKNGVDLGKIVYNKNAVADLNGANGTGKAAGGPDFGAVLGGNHIQPVAVGAENGFQF